MIVSLSLWKNLSQLCCFFCRAFWDEHEATKGQCKHRSPGLWTWKSWNKCCWSMSITELESWQNPSSPIQLPLHQFWPMRFYCQSQDLLH
jgi:hypothetical protein